MSLKRVSAIAFFPNGDEVSGWVFLRERDVERGDMIGFVSAINPSSAMDCPTGTIFLPFAENLFVGSTKEQALVDPSHFVLDVPIYAPRMA